MGEEGEEEREMKKKEEEEFWEKMEEVRKGLEAQKMVLIFFWGGGFVDIDFACFGCFCFFFFIDF